MWRGGDVNGHRLQRIRTKEEENLAEEGEGKIVDAGDQRDGDEDAEGKEAE